MTIPVTKRNRVPTWSQGERSVWSRGFLDVDRTCCFAERACQNTNCNRLRVDVADSQKVAASAALMIMFPVDAHIDSLAA
jgi:hypothetical protein